MPMTAILKLLWPIYILTLAVSGCVSAYSKYLPKLVQFTMSSGKLVVPMDSMFWISTRFSGATGAMDKPH